MGEPSYMARQAALMKPRLAKVLIINAPMGFGLLSMG